jgi:hypothetical protein
MEQLSSIGKKIERNSLEGQDQWRFYIDKNLPQCDYIFSGSERPMGRYAWISMHAPVILSKQETPIGERDEIYLVWKKSTTL